MLEARQHLDAIVIGAGQAGLAASYYLNRLGVQHLVLERARVAHAWRGRWDSLALVTPNWMVNLPGYPNAARDPDGFMSRDEIVAYLEGYARSFNAPVREGVEVHSLRADGEGFALETSAGPITARSVIVAAGGFQRPKSEPLSGLLPLGVQQLHSSTYLNPESLPPGGVLVVGSGQSGAQIAEELFAAGRRVYLSVGRAARLPRRYRGRDATRWAAMQGLYETTRDQVDTPRARLATNAHVSGQRGGRSVNLRHLAREGMVLLGRLEGVRDGVLEIATDLLVNLAAMDEEESKFLAEIDEFIEREGIAAPPREPAEGGKPFDPAMLLRLDLRATGVTSVIWATGYDFAFPWVKADVLDRRGHPVQERGATALPGLYFLGLPWLHKAKSGLLYGVGDDAAHVAGMVAGRAAPAA